jgi:hypothetical protein
MFNTKNMGAAAMTDQNPTFDVTRFHNLEDALNASNQDEQHDHSIAKSYNETDYNSQIEDQKNSALNGEWLVINGCIYYLFKQEGRRKGLTLLNRLNVGGLCLSGGPMFYASGLMDDECFTKYDGGEVTKFSKIEQNFELIAKWGRECGFDFVISSCGDLLHALQTR